MKTLVVPIDGSEISLHAFDEACKLANKDDKIYLITVVPEVALLNSYGYDSYSKELNEIQQEQAKRMMEDARNNIGKDLDIEMEVLMGNVGNEIIDFANDKEADLIVMGNRGRGALSRTILGSVSQKVLNSSSCSVFVVKNTTID